MYVRDVGWCTLALWLMSDAADQYYLAWISVFDHTPQKLLCTWHVDRAWRGALQQYIRGMKKQATVYAQLRVLVEEAAMTCLLH